MSSALIRIAYTVTEDSALLQRFAMLEGPIRNPGIVSRHFAWKYGNWSMRAKKKEQPILCEKAMQIIDKEYGGSVPVSGGRQKQQHSCEPHLPECPDQKKSTRVKLRGSVDEKRVIETARELVLGSSMKMREIAGALRLQ